MENYAKAQTLNLHSKSNHFFGSECFTDFWSNHENPIFSPSDKSSDPSNDHFSPDLTGRTNTNMVDQNSLSFLQDICKVSCERKIVFYCWLQG